MIRQGGIVAAVAVWQLWSGTAFGQNATTAGSVTIPYPTTQAISIEWAITGDANNDGVVQVRYRQSGATAWSVGFPLVRVPAGTNTTGDFGSGDGRWSNKHAGSLFDLAPDTAYEIELSLNDPDGGAKTVTTNARTRPIPAAAGNATSKPVTPTNFSSVLSAAVPGDVLVLGAGSYPSFEITRDGQSNKPIVIRGESADTVIVGGRITAEDRQWVYLENLSVQGEIRMNGASNMVVRGCKIHTSSGGITFEVGNDIPRNNYIVDNDVVGGATWVDDQLSADGYDGGEGIQFTGSGHVVCFNHVKGFRDNISLMEYDEAYEQVSIDICNNDIEEATDDGIEADSSMGNVRVMRNRIQNCFDGVSSQPDLGGPTYYIRNVMYNVLYSPFKFHNGTVGDVAFHNTVVKCGDAWGCYAGETWSRALFRNNIFLGGTGGGTYGGYRNGSGRIFDLADADATCSFDYDGVGSIGTGIFEGKIGETRFSSLATLQSGTTEKHAVALDLAVFRSQVAFPSTPYPAKPAADLQLAANSAAVDKGISLPGVNDGFSGAAPDLGAYELGTAPPVYGPRPSGAGGTLGTGGAAGGPAAAGGAGGVSAATGAGGVSAAGGAMGTGTGADAAAVGKGGAHAVEGGASAASAAGAGGVAATGGPQGSGAADTGGPFGTVGASIDGSVGTAADGSVSGGVSALPDGAIGGAAPASEGGGKGCTCAAAGSTRESGAGVLSVFGLLGCLALRRVGFGRGAKVAIRRQAGSGSRAASGERSRPPSR